MSEEITNEEKSFLEKKFNEFRVSGLKSYIAYLETELKNSADKPLKAAYHRYIEKQLGESKRKIEELI
ncbi:MAG: hypothetical protein AB8B53_06420 [Flavobacteriales bacterium]